MNRLKESYALLMNVFVGVGFIFVALLISEWDDSFLAALFLLAGAVYMGWNLIRLLISLLKWFKIRKELNTLFKGIFQRKTSRQLLIYSALLFKKSLLNFLKFTFLTVLGFLFKLFWGILITSIGSTPRYSTSSSRSGSYTPKNHSMGFVEGQVVRCEHCGRILPMGATYDRSRPRCSSCYLV